MVDAFSKKNNRSIKLSILLEFKYTNPKSVVKITTVSPP